MYSTVDLHALAPAARGFHRIWVGVFDADVPDGLEWTLNGNPVAAGEVRALTKVALPGVVTQTGVFEVPVSAGDHPLPDTVQVTAVWPGRREDSPPLTTRVLPDELPTGLGETFNVLAVSCFYEPGDSVGKAGALVASLSSDEATRPHLVIAMGDQVYLDNPYLKAQTLYTKEALAQAFEVKYRKNWQSNPPEALHGFAQILRAAPVASIPDDHEYWNNYPQPSIAWPATMFEESRDNWQQAARASFDAFQLAETDRYTYRIDVPPLSFFFLDNRTFRTVSTRGAPGSSALADDLLRFDDWTNEVIASDNLLPVLITGPSLFQPPKGLFAKYLDLNLANLTDYPHIMEGLLKLSSNGRQPLALTGDVHYGRIISATHWTGNQDRPWSKLYEVISSPVSLVAGGSRSEAKTPDRFFHVEGTTALLDTSMQWPVRDANKMGDHVALLKFSRSQTGVDVETIYWMINEPGRSMNPIRAPRFKLRRL